MLDVYTAMQLEKENAKFMEESRDRRYNVCHAKIERYDLYCLNISTSNEMHPFRIVGEYLAFVINDDKSLKWKSTGIYLTMSDWSDIAANINPKHIYKFAKDYEEKKYLCKKDMLPSEAYDVIQKYINDNNIPGELKSALTIASNSLKHAKEIEDELKYILETSAKLKKQKEKDDEKSNKSPNINLHELSEWFLDDLL